MKMIGLAAAAALSFGAVASANITMTYLGSGLHQTSGVNYNASRSWDARTAASFTTIKTGQLRWNVWGKERVMFCVQLFEGNTVGVSYEYECTDIANVPDAPPSPGPMGEIKATIVSELYRRFYSQTNTDLGASAFALALYEITHENLDSSSAEGAAAQLSLANGAFQASAGSSAFSTAAAMLASLGQGSFQGVGNNLIGLTNPDHQDQIVLVPIGAPAVIAGLGLLGVGLLRRRMK